MRVTLVYELPDELHAYKEALKIKLGDAEGPLTSPEYGAIKELHTAIVRYMLQPSSHDNLMHLNKMIDKYG